MAGSLNLGKVRGDTGPGVASGGTMGQFLVKKTGTDYDTEWRDGIWTVNHNPPDNAGNVTVDIGVFNIAYDATNKKFTKTVNGTTTDVVTVSTLKSDMSLNNVENKSSSDIRGELTSSDVTTALGFTPTDSTDTITDAQIDALFD